MYVISYWLQFKHIILEFKITSQYFIDINEIGQYYKSVNFSKLLKIEQSLCAM